MLGDRLPLCPICPKVELSLTAQRRQGERVMANAPPSDPDHKPRDLHISYSQYSQWLKCGKAYELQRVIGVEESPAWWSIGGNGVHHATEAYDLGQLNYGGNI